MPYDYTIDRIGHVTLTKYDGTWGRMTVYLQGDDARQFIEDIEKIDETISGVKENYDAGQNMIAEYFVDQFVSMFRSNECHPSCDEIHCSNCNRQWQAQFNRN